MKKSKLLIALMSASIAFVANAVTHQHIEGQNCPLHGDSFITPEGVLAKKNAQKELMSRLNIRGVDASATMDNPDVIDVVVLMHSTWIAAMKDKLSQNSEGKYYENGAQFAIERIKSQYAYYNESLKLQNVPVILRPIYFAEINNTIATSASLAEQQAEYNTVYNCVMNSKSSEINNGNQAKCESQGLFRINDITQSSADVMHYVREFKTGESAAGLGGFYQGIAEFDGYRTGWQVIKASNDAGENFYTASDVDSLRFGHVNASVMTHEWGHVFGGMHNVSTSEPADGKDNRAYSCGPRDPRSGAQPEDKRPTALWSSVGWVSNQNHRFYSNPDVIIDGDSCGRVGEANNLRVVKENAPLVALNKTMAEASSVVQFAVDTYQVTRAEGTVSIRLRRVGDLSRPAYLSVTAKDGSAWEGRDFDFGFKEVAFAAGEGEKTVSVTLLPRSERHADTQFSLQIHAAVGASVPTEGPIIRIISQNATVPGTVQFEATSVSVVEGAPAYVNVNRLNGQDGDIQFMVVAKDGTAKAGNDYTFSSGVNVIKSGEKSVQIAIPTTRVAGKQGPRSMTLTLSDVTGGALLGSVTTTSVTIEDAVEAGKLAFQNATTSVVEGNPVTLTIQRTEGTDADVTVQVRASSGTAGAGVDFTAFDQSVTLAAGQATASITIPTTSRAGSQGTRDFDVVMSNPSGGALLGNVTTARVSITDSSSNPPPATDSGSGGGGSVGYLWLVGLLLAVRMRRSRL